MRTNNRTIQNRFFSLFVKFLQSVVKLGGNKLYWKFFPRLIEEINLTYVAHGNGLDIKIYCGGELSRYRAETLFQKERDTIHWISSFPKGDVFMDIGANIGVYTLYAALSGNHQVISIEPAAANYANLSRNIQINGLGDLIYPICAAAHDVLTFDKLFMHSGGLKAGGSGAILGHEILDDDVVMSTAGVQMVIGVPVDFLVENFNVPFPNHLKIDILGTQDKVIRGARKTLINPSLKSAMVEIPPDQQEKHDFILSELKAAGFIEDNSFRVNQENSFFRKPDYEFTVFD